ncbi:response regulator transcription factor [Priestia koreensis]|uniref:response regulator transcription factor n=1 Tax=Priestia koreensis TaxID=284581 RepID=UPI001F5A3626|nr:response regulator transcription factor [Priestia koreensis]UNL87531.1 response regulator transcription factor [Priestia koreensis]
MKKVLIMEKDMIFREGLIQVLSQEYHNLDIKIFQSNAYLVDRYEWCLVDVFSYEEHYKFINELQMLGVKVIVFLKDFNADKDKLQNETLIRADGILLKTMKIAEVIKAFDTISQDIQYYHPLVAQLIIHQLKKNNEKSLEVRRTSLQDSFLTERELDILQLIAKGLNNNEIAEKLTLSPLTINSHMRRIFGKFDVNNRVSALVYALKNDFIKIN